MATKQPLKTTFDVERVIRPVYTGGSVAIDNKAQILATTLGEDAILTNPSNGKHLAKIEGVSGAPRVCKIEWKADWIKGCRSYFDIDTFVNFIHH